MSRSMSDTSLGSAFRNIKLAIFFFCSFFLCWLVLCMWNVVRFVSSSASQRFTLSCKPQICFLLLGKASSGWCAEASAELRAATLPPFIDAQEGQKPSGHSQKNLLCMRPFLKKSGLFVHSKQQHGLMFIILERSSLVYVLYFQTADHVLYISILIHQIKQTFEFANAI